MGFFISPFRRRLVAGASLPAREMPPRISGEKELPFGAESEPVDPPMMTLQRRQFLGRLILERPAANSGVESAGRQDLAAGTEPSRANLRIGLDHLELFRGEGLAVVH